MTGLTYLDAAAVRAALTPAEAVEAIAGALTGGFDPTDDIARVGPTTSSGQFLLMPSEVGAHAGVKVATVAPGNTGRGLPRIQATYLLFDAGTLSLTAVLDGTALTELRTPAVSVAAARGALERIDRPARIVIIGAGPQAVGHADTLRAVLGHEPGSVSFVVRRPERAGAEVRDRGVVLTAGGAEAAEALGSADVVVCATSARTPLFPADAVGPEAVVIAVGSHEPDARELAPALLAGATVIVEDRATALREAGDVVLAIRDGVIGESDLVTMADVVRMPASVPGGRRTVVKTVGMSWQDLVIAEAVHARAR
ncbi:MAG: ornithine cyclodeaminase family protein [Actinomycetaceae bacterium]